MRARSTGMKRYGVRLSVCPSVRLSPAAAACGGFAAVGPAGWRYRSIAAHGCIAARSSKCGLCHFSTARRTLCYCGICYRRVSVFPSVCPSQAGTVSNPQDESSWFLAWRLPSTFPTLCFKHTEIWLSPKIRVLPSATLSQTPDLENFATAKVDCVVNKTRRRSSLLTTPKRQSTSRGCLLQVGQP